MASLPTTDWSLVESAGLEPSPGKTDAMQALLLRYLPALKAHVRARWRVMPDQADDWLQEFVSVKVIQQRLITQASFQRGRFRDFLRKSLDSFVVSQLRYSNAKKRSSGQTERWTQVEEALIADDSEPSRAFDVEWARQVVAQAVGRMEVECQKSHRDDLWGLFQTRLLFPILDGSPVPSYEQMVERFGFGSPLQAANALTTAKRMFQRNLLAVLSEYANSEEQIEEELAELQTLLAGGRG